MKMTRRTGATVAVAVFVAVGAILATSGCSEKPPAAPARTPLTPAMAKEFGAARFLPTDVSSYTSSMQILRQVRQLWESRAVQNLVMLPFVQMAWSQMAGSSEFTQAMAMLRAHPAVEEALPILEDAIATEVFSCTGPEFVEFARALSGVVNALRLAVFDNAFAGRDPAAGEFDLPRLVEAVLQHRDQLRLPSLMIGFKLTDENAAKQFLARWLPQLEPVPVGRIETRIVKGAEFRVLELTGASLPEGDLASITREFEREGVPQGRATELADFVRRARLSVAVGVLDGYLMLSVGADTTMLSKWGAAESLAESDEFEPLRARFQGGLLSIGYVSEATCGLPVWTPEEIREFARKLIDAIPDDAPVEGLKDRLRKDADLLASDLGAPAAGSLIAFSRERRGIESFTFGPPPNGMLDYAEPLSILTHRGRGPIAVLAARAAKRPGAYDAVATWLVRAFGYVEDFVVPQFGPADREGYEMAMGLARPFLASIHDTTREYLVPAIDGTQALQLVDGHGELGALPDGRKLTPVVPLPRFGAAMELKDPVKFVVAIERYIAAAKTLFDGIRRTYDPEIPPELDLPSPVTEAVAGGTLYSYRLPWDLGRDVCPCALLKGDLLVLASSAALAVEMAGTVPMPDDDVVATAKAAGELAMVDFQACHGWLSRLTNSVFLHMQQERIIGPRDTGGALVVKMHVDALLRSLRAFRGYRCLATLEDGRVVYHSWLHVEDVPE